MKTPIKELIDSVGNMAQGLDADELYDYFMEKATQMLEKEQQVMCEFAIDYTMQAKTAYDFHRAKFNNEL